ncbi:MAG: hypothetical protein WBD36_09695 [Bacteroidota bacterium]
MTESTRRHERIDAKKEFAGVNFKIENLLPKPIEVFLPQKSTSAVEIDLLIHFLGANYVVQNAAVSYNGDIATALISLGSGSSVFNNAFVDTTMFPGLLDSLHAALQARLDHPVKFRRLYLSGFSAGYGAIRRILSSSKNYDLVDGVLLLDGIHASYVPERKVLAEGGRVDSNHLETFLKLAADASRESSRKRFLITHSEIFPGTFVSTTESTDFLLNRLEIKRTPLLQWGPLGMQQLSEARAGHFLVMGFAGNAAQDHVDHLQSLFFFLNLLSTL